MSDKVHTVRSKPSIWIFLTGILLSLGVLHFNRPGTDEKHVVGIPKDDFDYGLQRCASFGKPKKTPNSSERVRNPRFAVGFEKPAQSVLITNATLLNGDGKISFGYDIVMQDGLFKSVGKLNLEAFDGEVINAHGRFVTPGIVDMHSHMGVDSWPGTEGHADTNEMTESPVHPELKSLDGFDPWDLAIEIINSGGITTSLVLPGSGNMMGGEAFAFKHRKTVSNRAEDMLLHAGMTPKDGHQWRWMKMACGENPIRSYGPKNIMPGSRLGEGYVFRRRIDQAYKAKQAQDQWCYEAETAKARFKSKGHQNINRVYPEPIEHESLIALLRGDVFLNFHCYETYDLEMVVRLAKQYGFKIRAFHHALEAWRVAELLAKEDIGAAIFSDHWGYKKEAYDSSVKAATILSEKGVKVAFKSDHPVLNSQNLVFEAAKGHHYGLSAELAIQAITSIPAERLGQDWRIGYVRNGYDADLVIWDKHPLELGAHPLRVFVDGFTTFRHSDYNSTIGSEFEPKEVKVAEDVSVEVELHSLKNNAVTYTNIAGLVASPDAKWEENSKIVVENDTITCTGSKCESKGEIIDLKNGWVIPGIIASGVHLGLEVIASESVTSAGRIEGDTNAPITSSYGVRIGREKSRQLDAAFKAGVTTAVVAYRNRGPIGAISTAFRVGAKKFDSSKYVRRDLMANFVVGNSALDSTLI
jgi:imidazolonepropionase-like amidohydrolase